MLLSLSFYGNYKAIIIVNCEDNSNDVERRGSRLHKQHVAMWTELNMLAHEETGRITRAMCMTQHKH